MKKYHSSVFVILCVLVFVFSVSSVCSQSLFKSSSDLSKILKGAEAIKNTTESFSKAFEDITPENEYYIGRSVAANILVNYDIYTNDNLEQYLNVICQSLVINSDIPEIYNGYHVKILDSDEINAFATSGGHIFITKGLIGCTSNEDSLAAVIAHELGHIQLKHGLKAIKTSRFTEAGIQTVKSASSVAEISGAQTLNGVSEDIVTQMVNSGYSQNQEFDADSFAIDLLRSSGYAPAEIITMLELIDKQQNGKSGGMYKTHPSPKSRIAKAKAKLGKNEIAVNSVRTERYENVMKLYKNK